eukprot:gene11165-3223_t
MEGNSALRQHLQAVFHCFLWYTGSMLNSILGKSAMKVFPKPVTVTLSQLIIVNICLPFVLSGSMPRLSRADWVSWIIPLAFLKIVVSLSSQLSILKVPVSYAHTGVVIASVTELEFNMLGLLSAILATFTFAVQNIYSKKVMKRGVDHIAILILVSRLSLLALLPYWFYEEGVDIIFGETLGRLGDQAVGVIFQVTLCGLSSAIQTIAAFTFLSYVNPVTYSVANVAKRIVIISASMLFFQTPATPANVFGMAISICGIGMYNKAKIDSRRRQQAKEQVNTVNKGPFYV